MNEIFKKFRNLKGLTQKDFAEKIGVSRATIAQIEAGNNNVSTDILVKISNAFNINLKDFDLKEGYLVDRLSNKMLGSDSVNEIIVSKLSDNTYSDLSEVDYLKQKSPNDLKNETKLFMLNYRQRLLDSLQLLMSVCKALKYLGYKFSEKEIDEIIFYDDFITTVKELENSRTTLTAEIKENLINVLDKNLFGIISKYTYKIDSLIGDDGVNDWEDLIKHT